jgi:hypothetical protein
LIGLTIIPSLITGGQPQARPEKTVSANLVLGSRLPETGFAGLKQSYYGEAPQRAQILDALAHLHRKP